MCFKTDKACLFQTKTICTRHENIPLCSLDFFLLPSPTGMSFSVCVHCIFRNKLQTFILGIQHFHVFILHVVNVFRFMSSCTGRTVRRLFVLRRDRKHWRTPQKRSLKTLQQHVEIRGNGNGASGCHFRASCLTVFNPLMMRPGFRTLFHRKFKAYFPPCTIKTFWQAV